MADTIVINETPSRLTLVNVEGNELILAPLEKKTIYKESGFYFKDLEREGIVSTRELDSKVISEQLLSVFLGGGFWLLIALAMLANSDPWFQLEPSKWLYLVWGVGGLTLAVVVMALLIRGTSSFTTVGRWARQQIVLLSILSIGFGLPAATIYFFGGGYEILKAPAALPEVSEEFLGPPLAVFGRLLQLSFIVAASLLPTLLFFLFDRYQLATLRKRLYINLFRILKPENSDDSRIMTISEINGRYREQIQEAYGTEMKDSGRLSPGSRMPVLVCAFIITVGWIIALAPVGEYRPKTVAEVMSSLVPQYTAVVFAFLGAYFYTLRLIALQYARGDLKPKAYTHIMVRIFLAVVVSWVLEVMFSDGTSADKSAIILISAFLVGYAPDNFFIWLKETSRILIPDSLIPQQTLPLNELEGIDIYDLGRLEAEGIMNIEGLAHHELMDMIIETGIPVPRLVDWVDQAILYLHLSGDPEQKSRKELRRYGIRTATDLIAAWEAARKRGTKEFLAFKSLLGNELPYKLEVIKNALEDDEWRIAVSRWRNESPYPDFWRNAMPRDTDEFESLANNALNENRHSMAI